MNKITVSVVLLLSLFIMSGCGQEMDVTVYNATGISSSGGWLAINVHAPGNDQWVLPIDYALSDEECDSTNSFTFKAKENDNIEIGGNGATFVDDGSGNISEQEFTLPEGEKIIYGEFLATPHWYAAVNMESIVFYKK